jgi:hypothetical protein
MRGRNAFERCSAGVSSAGCLKRFLLFGKDVVAAKRESETLDRIER